MSHASVQLRDKTDQNKKRDRLMFFVSLQVRLKKEQEEKEDKRRYKAQAHLYTIIKVKIPFYLVFTITCLDVLVLVFSVHQKINCGGQLCL